MNWGDVWKSQEGKTSVNRPRRLRAVLLRLLPFVAVAGLAWYQMWPGGLWEIGQVVSFRHQALQQAAFDIAAAAWILMLLLLCWGSLRHRLLPKGWGRVDLISLLVFLSIVELVSLGSTVFGWRDLTQLRLPDGSTYRVHSSLPAYLLTAEVRRGPLLTRERVLGYGDKEFPALLVRPLRDNLLRDRPLDGTRPSLLQSGDGRWLALVRVLGDETGQYMPSCQSHLVYDLEANKVYSVNDFADLSPFILVGPEDHLMPSDVEALLAGPRHVRPAGLNVIPPSPTTIAHDLINDNPEVRAAAARLLDTRNTQNSHLEDAEDTLQDVATGAYDPIARRAAEEALARLEAAR